MARALLRLGVGVAAILAPVSAGADTRVGLHASSELCDPAPLRARATELVGREAFVAAGTEADVDVMVGVAVESDRYRATIALRDRDGTERGRRVIEARDCAELTESAALVIALVLARPLVVEPVPIVEAHEPVAIVAAERPASNRSFHVLAAVAGGRAG